MELLAEYNQPRIEGVAEEVRITMGKIDTEFGAAWGVIGLTHTDGLPVLCQDEDGAKQLFESGVQLALHERFPKIEE